MRRETITSAQNPKIKMLLALGENLVPGARTLFL